VAIDPEAPKGKIFQAVSLENFIAPHRFHAVVTSRALHHTPDLRETVEKIARPL
jgi:hypothetical protein